MADTTNYQFNRPTVGGAEDVWGDRLNENWGKLDALLYGASFTDGDGNTVERIRPDLASGAWAIQGVAVTSTAAELNILDGVTATTAELNILDGVTATTAELNKLDGVTATTAELNFVDGVTSNIQSQFDALGEVGAQATVVTDWNSAIDSGFYNATDTAANAPAAQFFRGFVAQTASGALSQVLVSSSSVYVRTRTSGTFDAWRQVAETSYVDGRTPLPEEYESAEQAITSGGSLTLAHGLAAQPRLIMGFLRAKSAVGGYSIGDEVAIALGASSNKGVSVVPDATNINVRFGSNGGVFDLNNKTNGNGFTITNSDWRLLIKAWA